MDERLYYMNLLSRVTLVLLLVIPSIAMANLDPALAGKKAEMYVQSLGDEAIDVLEKLQGDDDAVQKEFKRILNKKFDMAALSRFAMGRYWVIATDAEKKEYTKLFNKMVIDVYSKRFSDYSGQNFEVVGNKPAGRKDFIVNSLIKGKGSPVKVDWRLRKGRVIDVIVAGVSMSVTQRSEFASIIQRNGGQVASLITHLQN
jgi:phospholipid transport system substrate-binding protein